MRIGILLGVMPRMLRDVVSAILGAEAEMCVVAEDVEHDALAECIARERADVVVVAVPSGPPPPLFEELLSRFPRLTVIALEDRGQLGSMYVLRPMRVRLGEVSGSNLVGAVRAAAVPIPFAASVLDVDALAPKLPGPSDQAIVRSVTALGGRTSS